MHKCLGILGLFTIMSFRDSGTKSTAFRLNFVKFSRTPILQNTCEQLLLQFKPNQKFRKIRRKHLCWSLLFNEVSGWKTAPLLKRDFGRIDYIWCFWNLKRISKRIWSKSERNLRRMWSELEANLKQIWNKCETNLKQIWNEFKMNVKRFWNEFETNG